MSDNANKNACNITKLEVEAESNGKQTLELELRYWTLTADNRLVEGAAPLKIALDLGPHEAGTQVYEVGGDPELHRLMRHARGAATGRSSPGVTEASWPRSTAPARSRAVGTAPSTTARRTACAPTMT